MSLESELLAQTIDILKQSDYEIFSNRFPDVELCFELIAKHRLQIYPSLLIKIIENIDSIKPYIINELKLLSRLMAAIPIIIGNENRRSKLSDDSLFIRDDLISLNINTFSKIVKNPQLPLAIAKQGGLFIDIDGEKLARLRTVKGISRKDIADSLQITPKAVSHYEMKGMRPSVEHAQKMGDILGDSIVIPLDFFDHGKKIIASYRFDQDLQKRILVNRREFVKMINEIVEGTGYKVFWSKASPFDILIYKDSDDSKEILDYTLVGGTTLGTDINTSVHQMQGKFFQELPQDSAFIYDEEKLNVKDIKKEHVPYIVPKELKTLENPKEFKKLINKRRLTTKWE